MDPYLTKISDKIDPLHEEGIRYFFFEVGLEISKIDIIFEGKYVYDGIEYGTEILIQENENNTDSY